MDVFYITTGETCLDILQDTQHPWWKRKWQKVSGKDAKSSTLLIPSSSKVVGVETHESHLRKQLQHVGQVIVLNRSIAATKTAKLVFPSHKADKINATNKMDFYHKLGQVVTSHTVAVVLTPEMLSRFTTFHSPQYFTIVKEECTIDHITGDVIPSEDEMISMGSSRYHDNKDEEYCLQASRKSMKQLVGDEMVEFKTADATLVSTCDSKGCKWMKLISGSTLLKDIAIPQAHDSATGYFRFADRTSWRLELPVNAPKVMTSAATRIKAIKDWSKTQDLSCEQQLTSGVRCFDMRVFVTCTETIFHHGAVVMNHSFWETLANFIVFQEKHKSETVILILVVSGNGDHENFFGRLMYEIDGTGFVVGGDASLTLEECRGKFVLFTEPVSHNLAQITSDYKIFNQPKCKGERTEIVRTFEDFTRDYLPCFPLAKDAGNVHVMQCHTQVDLKTIAKEKNIRTSAAKFNSKFISYMKSMKGRARKWNIIELDFFRPSFMRVFDSLNEKHLSDPARGDLKSL
jgi:hypothetical protein